jgi:hypothetical protein
MHGEHDYIRTRPTGPPLVAGDSKFSISLMG